MTNSVAESTTPPLAHRVPEAGQIIGVGSTKMNELIRSGQIETVTIGRRRLVPHDALVAYLDRLRSAQAA